MSRKAWTFAMSVVSVLGLCGYGVYRLASDVIDTINFIERLPDWLLLDIMKSTVALCVVVILFGLTIYRNPYEDKIMCLYDSSGKPKGEVRYGWHVKGILEKHSETACPTKPQSIPLSGQYASATGEIVIVLGRVVFAVGHRPLDIDRACRRNVEELLCHVENAARMYLAIAMTARAPADLNLYRIQESILTGLEKAVNKTLLDTGWHLVEVKELKFFPPLPDDKG